MCLNSSSASVACPFFISFKDAAYCCAAWGGTGAGTGAEFSGAPAAAAALAAGVSPWALAEATALAGATGAAGRTSRATGALVAGALVEGGALAFLVPGAPVVGGGVVG